ncbi:tetratricopeptide repeat protein [Microbulbifer agarilyticus]|uniref:hypothetical protein n=1 Tax=Microbulbifer agarilyticus TaxID=260552 RepID=UPI001CD73536|nr:hypothetical protein [Microbulbifer agarilyticus]MCA0900598.1 hypothetical protein [Microbulbifer agarilyticus]
MAALLPACSLVPTTQPTLEGFPAETAQRVRQQSTELDQLQSLNAPSPSQQRQLRQLRRELHRFEREVLESASRLERKNEWYRAAQQLEGAIAVLPTSPVLTAAYGEFQERRKLRGERVRMEIAIHQGEQLLKDIDAYKRLQQLQGRDVLTWVELKNFNRKRRASAEELQKYAELALLRKDYGLAQSGLKVAKALYGDDLEQDKENKEQLEQSLTEANHQLRKRNPRRTKVAARKPSPASAQPIPTAELEQTLDNGDLPSARQQLTELEQQAPDHPELQTLQARFDSMVSAQLESALQRGNELYSQGEIEQALAVWREAHTLAPENMELRGNISRAERVLENLRALSTPNGAKP